MVKLKIEVTEANGGGKDIIKTKGLTVKECWDKADNHVKNMYNLPGGWLLVYMVLALSSAGVITLKNTFLQDYLAGVNLIFIGLLGIFSSVVILLISCKVGK